MYQIFFIDDAHGYDNKRCTRTHVKGSVENLHEYEFNSAVVQFIIEKIQKSYLIDEIFHVNPTDKDIAITERTKVVNNRIRQLQLEHGVDDVQAVFITVHASKEIWANTWVESKKHGTETYYSSFGLGNKEFATLVHENLIKQNQRFNIGCRAIEEELYSYHKLNCVSAHCECEFLSYEANIDLLREKQFQKQCALGIVYGVVNYLDLRRKKQHELKSKLNKPDYAVLDKKICVKINPLKFYIINENRAKKNFKVKNYFNLGSFVGMDKTEVISTCNLANDGKILAQTKDLPENLLSYNRKVSTLIIKNDGSMSIVETNNLENIKDLKTAISGTPIVLNGEIVDKNIIRKQGFLDGVCDNSYHGFLGLKADSNKLFYYAFECDFSIMGKKMIELGFENVIKLEGGRSFVFNSDFKTKFSTKGNQRIASVGVWE